MIPIAEGGRLITREAAGALAGFLLMSAALTACQGQSAVVVEGSGASQRGRQLDITLRTVGGIGPMTTVGAPFPHARYTFFTDEDPAGCVLGVRLEDMRGLFIGGDATDEQPPPEAAPGQFRPSPVQLDVPDGLYRVHVGTTTSRCVWVVNEVLNSMSTAENPPSAEPAPPAPTLDASVNSSSPTATIDIPVVGIYNVTYDVNYPPGGNCRYQIGFRNLVGDFEFIGEQSPQPPPPPPGIASFAPSTGGGGGGPFFLVAGVRHVVADTNCSGVTWQIAVAPWIGSLGGGTRGFGPRHS